TSRTSRRGWSCWPPWCSTTGCTRATRKPSARVTRPHSLPEETTMIHRIKRLSMGLVGLAACGAITSGCGVSSGGSGGGAGANATGGIPATASSAKLRDHELRGLQGKTMAWVPVGLGTPLTEEWTRQLKQGAQAAGMKFVLRDPNWDVQKQADAVRSLINEHPDVLIVHNFDVNLLAKLIQQAQAKGIYVLQVNMVSNYKSDAFVGADTI